MHSRLLKVVVAMLVVSVMACAAFGAPAKATKATKTAAPAKTAAPDAKFDQAAVLMKLWNSPDSTVVGSVNGITVTKGELLKTLWLWNAPSQLQDILTEKMIESEAKKTGVTLTAKELDEKAQESIKRSGSPSLDALLSQYRITKYRFQDANRLNALAEKAVQKNVKVTDAEYAEWVKARHILIRKPQDEKDPAKADEAAKKKIDEIYAKLKAGGDFVALANEFTEDPSNSDGPTKKGGDLGWTTKGRMVQDFEDAMFKLKAGEYSEPVKTFYGYHIIRVDALGKDASPADKAMLKKMILEQKLPQQTSQWYSELVSRSKIENKLVEPVKPQPKPVIKPQPAPKPKTEPKTEAKPEAKPEAKSEAKPEANPEAKPAPSTESKPAEPASTEKPNTPPPPPPPPAAE